MKKGFTIIELAISMVLISLMTLAVAGILPMILSNYRVNYQKATLQRDMNLVSDMMTRDIRNGASIEASGGGYSAPANAICGVIANPNIVIIGVPAIDADGNYLYASPSLFRKDLIIYVNDNGSLKRIVVPDTDGGSVRTAENKTIATDVSALTLDCSNPNEVVANFTITKNAGKAVSASSVVRARLRNS